MSDMCLNHKVAIVTDGGRGLGRGTALSLAAPGADLAIADINLADAQSVASEVRLAGREALAIQMKASHR